MLHGQGNFDPKNTILLVEDNQMEQSLIPAFLRHGFPEYHIVLAKNGEEAVKFVEIHKQFKFIIMDNEMRPLNGLEATKQIRALDEANGYRNIIITNSSTLREPFKDENGKEIADGYLIKEEKKTYKRRIEEVLAKIANTPLCGIPQDSSSTTTQTASTEKENLGSKKNEGTDKNKNDSPSTLKNYSIYPPFDPDNDRSSTPKKVRKT